MCLAIPMKIIAIEDKQATAEVGRVQYRANLTLLPDARIGDYIIVHAGFAIEKLNEAEAHESLQIWQEMAEAVENKRRR